MAVSMDDAPTMKKFKESLKADYAMVPDPQGKVVGAYDVKASPFSFAQRFTFVIGMDGKVLQVQSGSDAIDPGGAIKACPIRKPAPASGPDGGTPRDGGR